MLKVSIQEAQDKGFWTRDASIAYSTRLLLPFAVDGVLPVLQRVHITVRGSGQSRSDEDVRF